MKPLLGILIVAAWISPLNAQDTTTASPEATPDAASGPDAHPYRNPRKALILGSLIPGAGHIYAGEYWHGVVNYEVTVGTIGGGVLTYMLDKCTFSFLSTAKCDPGSQWPHQALGVAEVGFGIWHWVSSARDASRAAERANEKHRRKMAQARPIIEPSGGLRGGWHAGVAIPW
jgi:hypothetical protein